MADMTANPTEKPKLFVFDRLCEYLAQASPNDVIDRVEKALATPDESETVQDE